jgi:Leucine-rich repeat (LRR) protein
MVVAMITTGLTILVRYFNSVRSFVYLNYYWNGFKKLAVLVCMLQSSFALALEHEADLEIAISEYHQNPAPTLMETLDLRFTKFIYTNSRSIYERLQEFQSIEDEKVILDLSSISVNPAVLPLTFKYLAIKFPKLYGINLSNNQLSILPESISELRKLRKLALKNNRFSTFPGAVLKMKRLRWLSISENQIELIPEEIGTLKHLKTLFIDNNRIKFIPNSLLQFEGLKIRGLKSNPLLQKNLGMKVSVEKVTSLKHLCLLQVLKKIPNFQATLLPVELNEDLKDIKPVSSMRKVLVYWHPYRGKLIPFGKMYSAFSMCPKIVDAGQNVDLYLFSAE